MILLRNWVINKDIQIGREGGIIGRTIPQIDLDGVCENLKNRGVGGLGTIEIEE